LLGDDRIRLTGFVANHVYEISELVDPILLEHVEVGGYNSLLNGVEHDIVGSVPYIANPFVHGTRGHIQSIRHMLPEPITHLVAGFSDVSRATIVRRVQAVDVATHGKNRLSQKWADEKKGFTGLKKPL